MWSTGRLGTGCFGFLGPEKLPRVLSCSVCSLLFYFVLAYQRERHGREQCRGGNRKAQGRWKWQWGRGPVNPAGGSNHCWRLRPYLPVRTEGTYQAHWGVVLGPQLWALEQPQLWWAGEQSRPQPYVEEVTKTDEGLWRRWWTPTQCVLGREVSPGSWVLLTSPWMPRRAFVIGLSKVATEKEPSKQWVYNNKGSTE